MLPPKTDAGTIRLWIRETCEANKCPELAQGIIVKWNKRYTSCMGKALYRGQWDMTVSFSVPLWPRANQEERKQTVIHETCHIITRHHYGYQVKPHGREWKRAMMRAGVNPKRCHSVSTAGLKRKTKQYKYDCGCQVHTVGKVRHQRIQNGTIYRCARCKCRLRSHMPMLKTEQIGPMTVVGL